MGTLTKGLLPSQVMQEWEADFADMHNRFERRVGNNLLEEAWWMSYQIRIERSRDRAGHPCWTVKNRNGTCNSMNFGVGTEAVQLFVDLPADQQKQVKLEMIQQLLIWRAAKKKQIPNSQPEWRETFKFYEEGAHPMTEEACHDQIRF